jgi:GNAT superfamily N-acetyltransferase
MDLVVMRLEPGAIDRILAHEPMSHGSTALRHAMMHQRPGLWGSDPARPSSIAWLRAGDDQTWEAFASGVPGPALDWIAPRIGSGTVALVAPRSWEGAIRRRGVSVETATILMFSQLDLMKLAGFSTDSRALTVADAPAFESVAPAWALRSWGDFGLLIDRGLALGLFSAEGLVSTAWTYESDPTHDKIGVATLPRFRRLGLGRRVASALLDRVVRDRLKEPIWVTSSANAGSIALAKSLGFANPSAETLFRWTPA